MSGESRIKVTLSHLAWLARYMTGGENNGRAFDAAILTYNAAAILQWQFIAAVSPADTIPDGGARATAAKAIDDFVVVARRIVSQSQSGASDDRGIRNRLAKEIGRVLEEVPRLMFFGPPAPARSTELEDAPNVPELLTEFVNSHKTDHREAIARGRARGAKGDRGPYAAIKEAVAALVYVHAPEKTEGVRDASRLALAALAAGFLKTAVEMQHDDTPAVERRRWKPVVEGLMESAAEEGDA